MRRRILCIAACAAIVFWVSLVIATPASAQGAPADYARAKALQDKYDAAAIDIAGAPTWIGQSDRFWYRRISHGQYEFVIFDAETKEKKAAFDQAAIAASLSRLSGEKLDAKKLPFETVQFDGSGKAFVATISAQRYRCTVADSVCTKQDMFPGVGQGFGTPGARRPPDASRLSPDGKWEAVIDNYNIAVRPAGERQLTILSTDGSEGNYYELSSVVWSPDSKKIAAYRVRPGYHREVHYVESSPEDQVQPKSLELFYAKPGDTLDLQQPAIFDMASKRETTVSNALFPNPFDLTPLVWGKDGRSLTFEYNQRGHQIYRVIEVNAETGAARAIISEEPKTFFYYSLANDTLSAGKRYRHDIDDGKEIIWMSERDGWNHLYLYDGATGAVKNQITHGEWAVRGIERVDDEKRQIWFCAGGTVAGQDPYFANYFRINFDGTGLTRLTPEEANHTGAYSFDGKYFAETYSRVDLAPTLVVRNVADNSVAATVERGDASELIKAGWKPPEVFSAKGRDGKTDIWGVLFHPTNFDGNKKYPVIEYIYAGPHGSFVPKSFMVYSPMMAQAEIGFAVAQIDGMGTSNRSKAFHDVAWMNIADAGFPDRILWHKAVAAKYPWYDVSRVGIYGGSAGGQNSLAALLFHPDFYKVAVSYAGCHDNRMDKIWWNEQWMGWPIGPQYSASSNVDNAWRLKGDVLLIVGELDTNVDPSSTMQVVSQLMKHNKNFDLLVVPGADHPAARGDKYAAYGDHKRFDFFVQHLWGKTPPSWNQAPAAAATEAAQQ
ncbi:MAG TPA: prolyl oligopeptidase family serine peptidase [Candidatus Acidoferrales bacterium]|nr:prolyl oligopeptidase family serine peptidase [Candidatus Acidoferrales bacterium]